MKRNDNPYDKMLNTAGRAAKAAASGLLLALLLAGCSQKNPVKTQPISSMESSSEALGETSQTAAASEISPSASHYEIRKTAKENRTVTQIKRLSEDQMTDELARLLGGAEITEAVRQNAREMRALAAEKKRLNRQTP